VIINKKDRSSSSSSSSAVKLHYNGHLGTTLKGPLYPKSVISTLGHG